MHIQTWRHINKGAYNVGMKGIVTSLYEHTKVQLTIEFFVDISLFG